MLHAWAAGKRGGVQEACEAAPGNGHGGVGGQGMHLLVVVVSQRGLQGLRRSHI